jgi:hypothetical protein
MEYVVPRAAAVPLADDQVSFQFDGVERLRWQSARRYPRPFFYPLIGPSGRPLTRMGHPAAPDHDHHRSVWFAHEKIAGVNFWPESIEPQIRQERWMLYEDGEHEAAMIVELGWFDAHNARLMRQQLVAAVRLANTRDAAGDLGELQVEVQATFTPEPPTLQLERTNFGFFAVRVAKSLSAHYGGGRLTSSAGVQHEKNIHEHEARWVDYSGPIDRDRWEGITYFDHPTNPHQPTLWHVRDDGWMSASFNQRSAFDLTRERPLVLRYLLHAHRGDLDAAATEATFRQFAESTAYEVVPRPAPHRHALQRKQAARNQ